MMFGDAHLHYKGLCYDGIEDAGLLCVCSAEHSDWMRIKDVPDTRLVRFYGIHPWYADQWTDKSSNELVDLLEADPMAGVGEIGLDQSRDDNVLQAKVFTQQLMVASELGRCVSIHNVRSEGWIQRILRNDGGGCRSVILHSFTGPVGSIESFLGMNCYFSVSPRILLKSVENARLIMGRIPEDRLLLETDAPHYPGSFTDMPTFIADIAGILGMDPRSLAHLTLSNLREALG